VTVAESKIVDRVRLAGICEELRSQGKRVVFTNGCFDLLHAGHARYLAEARGLGDALVVGVNSNRSVRSLKGPSRPIVPEEERAELLAHLQCTDFVCLFDEDRPDSLIEAVKPRVHVKGGDYTEDQLPEAEVVRRSGGEIVILPLVEGRSTSNLIERIASAAQGTSVALP
jgi:glycerol-3-phosphate cytidylyltransferase